MTQAEYDAFYTEALQHMANEPAKTSAVSSDRPGMCSVITKRRGIFELAAIKQMYYQTEYGTGQVNQGVPKLFLRSCLV